MAAAGAGGCPPVGRAPVRWPGPRPGHPPALSALLSLRSSRRRPVAALAMGAQDRPQCHFDIEINREPGEWGEPAGAGARADVNAVGPGPEPGGRGAGEGRALRAGAAEPPRSRAGQLPSTLSREPSLECPGSRRRGLGDRRTRAWSAAPGTAAPLVRNVWCWVVRVQPFINPGASRFLCVQRRSCTRTVLTHAKTRVSRVNIDAGAELQTDGRCVLGAPHLMLQIRGRARPESWKGQQ